MKNPNTKALLSFTPASDADLSTFATRVIAGITGNSDFPTAQKLAADLVPALADYTRLLASAQGGSRAQIEAKNVSRTALLDLLREGCRLVNFDANGDRFKLLTSGYDITGETKKSAPARVVELKAA